MTDKKLISVIHHITSSLAAMDLKDIILADDHCALCSAQLGTSAQAHAHNLKMQAIEKAVNNLNEFEKKRLIATIEHDEQQSLSDEFEEFCRQNGFALISADELKLHYTLSVSQISYLDDYVQRWEAAN